MLVRSLMAKGDASSLSRADTELKSLLQQYPNARGRARPARGSLQTATKDYAGARKSFDRALQLNPNDTEAVAGLVSTRPHRAQAGRCAQARRGAAGCRAERSGRALPRRPHLSLDRRCRAARSRRCSRRSQAAPGTLQAYGLLGELYLGQKKLDEARQKFEELAQRQPKPVGPHTMVAMILQMQGKNAEAQKRYEKVLEIDRTAPVAANNLAWMYAEGAGNIDVALQLAQTAKAGLPDSPEVNDTLGWIYYKKDLAGLAIAPLQQAVGQGPEERGLPVPPRRRVRRRPAGQGESAKDPPRDGAQAVAELRRRGRRAQGAGVAQVAGQWTVDSRQSAARN